jgi:putative efflux protein, MATE family
MPVNNESLGSEKIPRLVLKFTSTTLAALVLNSVYNITDTLFVSRGVGVNAMGGVAVVFPFMILQGAISTMVGGGAASLVSRKLGEGRPDEAGGITLNAMLVFYITSAVITILGFAFMKPLLKIMGVTGELYPYAKQYLSILLAGNIFSTGFSSIIRAEGKMLYALLIWIVPITVNIILDAIFILVLRWGVAGAAAATVFCQFTSFSMCILFFAKFSKQSFKGARPSSKTAGAILAIGLPSLAQLGSLSLISLLLNNVIRDAAGTSGVNVYAYVNKFVIYAAVPVTALTQALTPIVGYNHGAGKPGRVKETVRFCIFLSFLYAAAALIVGETIPGYLIKIFTDDGEIVRSGADALRIVSAAVVFMPLPMLAGATMQAEGKKLWALVMYSSNFIFLTPLSLLLSRFSGLNGVWWSYVAATACASVFAAVKLFIDGAKK